MGTHGRLGCFSFQSTKTLTTGEGGLVLTDDDELARRLRVAVNVGETTERGEASLAIEEFAPNTPLAYESLGWNYRMGALQAALGLGQLQRMDSLCAARVRNAAHLRARLQELPGLRLQAAPAGAEPCPSSFFLELEPGAPDRDELTRALRAERVDYRLPYQRPLAGHPLFRQPGSFPVAERICRRALGLRVDPALRRRDLDSVADALARLLAWKGRPRP